MDKLWGSHRLLGVIESEMELVFYLSCKARAALFGSSTNGNYIVPGGGEVMAYRCGVMMSNRYTSLLNNLYRLGDY